MRCRPRRTGACSASLFRCFRVYRRIFVIIIVDDEAFFGSTRRHRCTLVAPRMSSSSDDADERETNEPVLSRSFVTQSATRARPRVFVRRSDGRQASMREHINESISAQSSADKKRKSPAASSAEASADNRPLPVVISYGKPNGSLLPPAGFRRRRHAPPPRLTAEQLSAIAARPRVPLPPPGTPMYGVPGAQALPVGRRRRRERFVPSLVLQPPPLRSPPSAAAVPNDSHPLPPNHFDLSTLLQRREAEPFRESISMADREPLDSLPGIEDVLAALDVEDDDEDADDLFIPVGDDESDEDDDIVSVVERLSHTAMFTPQALESLLPLVTAKQVDDEQAIRQAAVAYIGGFVRPELTDVVAAVGMRPASAELTAVVPADWYDGGKLLVGKSTARGQCLFSSVGILLFGSGADRTALHLRALCIFELVERWLQYVEWFDCTTVRDMLASLVGAPDEDSQKFGFAWPTAEVVLLLSNVLQRRIVIVKRFSSRLRGLDHSSDPHVFLPLLGNCDEWSDAEPLVVVFDGDHYKPLSCAGGHWSIDFNRLDVDFQQASPALVAAFEPLRLRGLCGEVRIGVTLDAAQ
jgi:hypothetical protein